MTMYDRCETVSVRALCHMAGNLVLLPPLFFSLERNAKPFTVCRKAFEKLLE
jgi:hypothetical protein